VGAFDGDNAEGLGGGQCERVMIQCLLVAAPSFSVDLNPRLGSILRFRSTVNKAAFDIRIGAVILFLDTGSSPV
jgi:hypothetical protein